MENKENINSWLFGLEKFFQFRGEQKKYELIRALIQLRYYKKLFKNISIKAHPDRGGTNEDFYTLKAAYDSDNLIGMIDLAVKYDIDYEIDSEDEVLLRKNIINYEQKIKDMQKSLAWVWSTTKSKKEKLDVIKIIEQQFGCKIPLNEIEDKL